MTQDVRLFHAWRHGSLWEWAARMIREGHYLHKMPDPRTSLEVYFVQINGQHGGALVVGRPEATRCGEWYGGVDDAAAGRCDVTRWQVLNLSRVWIAPQYQAGGESCKAGEVPGYLDRSGTFRSTLASSILGLIAGEVGRTYLHVRPPCFLDEPYEIRWLLSYCDTSKHRGTIYKAAGWDLYRTNDRGIQTWRTRLPALTAQQDKEIRAIAAKHPRSIRYRAERAQMSLALG